MAFLDTFIHLALLHLLIFLMYIFDFIRNNDESLGSTLFILGVLAFGLNYMNAVPKVLAWIYEWGEDTAMWIKAGITGGGALLWLAGNFLEKPAEAEAEPEEE